MRYVVACITLCWFILLHPVADAVVVACDGGAENSTICATDEEVLLQVRLQRGTSANAESETSVLSLNNDASTFSAIDTAMLKARMQTLLDTSSDDEPVNASVLKDLNEILDLVEDIRNTLNASFAEEQNNLERTARMLSTCVNTSRGLFPIVAGSPTLRKERADVSQVFFLHRACRLREVDEKVDVFSQAGHCGTFRTMIETEYARKPQLQLDSLNLFFAGFDLDSFVDQAASCKAAIVKYPETVQACKALQKSFEDKACQVHYKAVQAKQSCTSFATCRTGAGKDLADTCVETETAARRFETENMTLDLIQCLVTHLAEGEHKETATAACDDLTNYTGALNITCPDVPPPSEESACTSVEYPPNVTIVPGTKNWVATQYEKEDWFEDATNKADENATIDSLVECSLPGTSFTTDPEPW